MGKRLILVLALAFVVGLALTANAEVQNVKVSGDLEFDSVYRDTFDLRGKTDSDRVAVAERGMGTGDNIFIGIARVKVDADLTDNVSTTVRLIGEWLWGRNDNNNLTIQEIDGGGVFSLQRDANAAVDIDLAYVTLKEFLYSPLTLVVGRQELHYGMDMIIGDSDTNMLDATGNIPSDLSKRKSFDAVRAILNYDPLTVDLVYAKIASQPWFAWLNAAGTTLNGDLERIGNRFRDDTDLFGINANYKAGEVNLGKLKLMNTVLESYYWFRQIGPFAQGNGANPLDPFAAFGLNKKDQLHTFGARISTEPIEDMMFTLETAMQRGRANYAGSWNGDADGEFVSKRDAWALETGAMYNFKKCKYVPTLTALYAYFSGDDADQYDSRESKAYRGWDPMFENQKYGDIVNALMPQTNAQILGIIGTAKPMDDVTLKAEYYRYWLIDPYDFVPDYYTGQDWVNMDDHSRDAGQECDISVIYNYTEDVQLSLLAGWFWPGGAFDTLDGDNNVASEVIGSMKVSF